MNIPGLPKRTEERVGEVLQSQIRDLFLAEVEMLLKSSTNEGCNHERKNFKEDEQGLFHYRDRKIVPYYQTKKLVHTLHNFDPTMRQRVCVKTLKLLRIHYCWHGMQRTVQDVIIDCQIFALGKGLTMFAKGRVTISGYKVFSVDDGDFLF